MGIDSITEPKDIRHSRSNKSVDIARDCGFGLQLKGIVHFLPLQKSPPMNNSSQEKKPR